MKKSKEDKTKLYQKPVVVTPFNAWQNRSVLVHRKKSSSPTLTKPNDTLEPKEIIEHYTKGTNVEKMVGNKGEAFYDTQGHEFKTLSAQEVLMDYPVPTIGMDLSEIEQLTKGVKKKKEAFNKAVADLASDSVENS